MGRRASRHVDEEGNRPRVVPLPRTCQNIEIHQWLDVVYFTRGYIELYINVISNSEEPAIQWQRKPFPPRQQPSNLRSRKNSTLNPVTFNTSKSKIREARPAYFIQTQTQCTKISRFSFAVAFSGNRSRPFLVSLDTWTVFRRSLDLSGPQFNMLNPCLRIL